MDLALVRSLMIASTSRCAITALLTERVSTNVARDWLLYCYHGAVEHVDNLTG